MVALVLLAVVWFGAAGYYRVNSMALVRSRESLATLSGTAFSQKLRQRLGSDDVSAFVAAMSKSAADDSSEAVVTDGEVSDSAVVDDEPSSSATVDGEGDTAVDKLSDSIDASLRARDDGSDAIHLVFCVSCSQSKRLLSQSLLQISARDAGQQGPITAVISGCSDEDQARVLAEPRFYQDFRVHFSPALSPSSVLDVSTADAEHSKPFGLRHFLQNANPPVREGVIALIDPDFVFLRPLAVNTGQDVSPFDRDGFGASDVVTDGVGLAQDYTTAVASRYDARQVLVGLCTTLDQPCAGMDAADVDQYIALGAPYILTRSDWLRVLDEYCDLSVAIRAQPSPPPEAEALAYWLAAANHGIQHTRRSYLGVTHPKFADGGHQYWSFVDESVNPCADPESIAPPARVPPVAINQREVFELAALGDRGVAYSARAVPESILDCRLPVLELPPASAWDGIDAHLGDAEMRSRKKQEVWAECSLVKAVNRAARAVKHALCPAGFNAVAATHLMASSTPTR